MDENTIKVVLQEIRNEQHPVENDETLIGYIKDAEYDINEYAGVKIDFGKDLKAKVLLKNFVLYARYKRLAEFKALHIGEYSELKAKYYKPSSV